MAQQYFGLDRGLLGYVVLVSAVCSALFVLIALRDGYRKKTYGIPPLALVAFLSSWIIAVIGPYTSQSHLFPGSRAEFWQFAVPVVLGLCILLQYLKYGPTTHPLIPNLRDPYHLLLFVQWAVVYSGLWFFLVFYQDYYVNEMEPVANFVASSSMLASVYLRQKHLDAQSVPGAWLFLVGNLLLHGAMAAGNMSDPYPEAQHGYGFMYWTMTMILLLNVAYAVLLPRRLRELRAGGGGAA